MCSPSNSACAAPLLLALCGLLLGCESDIDNLFGQTPPAMSAGGSGFGEGGASGGEGPIQSEGGAPVGGGGVASVGGKGGAPVGGGGGGGELPPEGGRGGQASEPDAAVGGAGAGAQDGGSAGAGANECSAGAGGMAGCVESATCDSDCTPALCGDGVLNVIAGEECDAGGQTPTCGSDCKTAVCPANCRCENYQSSAYAFCDAALSREDAAAQCQKLRGHLVTIETSAEHRFVLSRLLGQSSFLGGTDQMNSGDWTWDTGAQFWSGGESGKAEPSLVAHWAVGQPTGSRGMNCLEMAVDTADGNWNDRKCEVPGRYACERAGSVLPTCGDGMLSAGEACDDQGASATCDADCTVPLCGDGILNTLANEACDDANADDLDTCSSTCSPQGLVAHWPMTEVGGTHFRERVSALDLKAMGFVIGPGQFMPLDGRADYLASSSGGNVEDMNFSTEMTLSLKARFGSDTGGFRPLVVKGLASGSHLYVAVKDHTLQAGYEVTGPEARAVNLRTLVGPLSDGKWHHIVLRFGANTWTLLVDREPKDTVSNKEGPGAIEGDWGLGGYSDGQGSKFMGALRGVRVYSEFLSDDELAVLAASD